MRHRAGQLDVPHALATHLGQRDFNAALLAHHTAVLEALVLAAQALVVFYRAKNFGAEQTVTFRLEGTVVDGLGLFDFTVRPGMDQVGRGQADANGVKVVIVALRL